MSTFLFFTFFVLDLFFFSALISKRFWRSRDLLFPIFFVLTLVVTALFFPGIVGSNGFEPGKTIFLLISLASLVGILLFTSSWFLRKRTKLRRREMTRKFLKLMAVVSFLFLFLSSVMSLIA